MLVCVIGLWVTLVQSGRAIPEDRVRVYPKPTPIPGAQVHHFQ